MSARTDEIKELLKSIVCLELLVFAITVIPFGGVGLVLFLFGDLRPFSKLLEALWKVFVMAGICVLIPPALIFSVGLINNFYERFTK